ncbi:MAG TPA: hypothetical protein ENI29_17585, partial [bacterium]|nr:hypothetical protein [bacterium]
MRLLKNKRSLAIISSLLIVSATSMISLPFILNTPDRIPPIIKITNPAQGANLSGIITIDFTATDQQRVITELQILIDGEIIQTSSYHYSWNTIEEVDGQHTITCRAKDNTLWRQDEISVFINNSKDKDKTLPNVTIISPTANSTVSGTVFIDMSATDDNGISSYAIFIDDIFKTGTKSYSWDTTQVNNGIHTILCEAFDPSGNIGTDTLLITVNNSEILDISSPNVTITSPVANSTVSGSVSIIMDALDDTGISSYAIYIDTVLKSSTSTYSWDTTQENNGTHTILCIAIDPSGNNGS